MIPKLLSSLFTDEKTKAHRLCDLPRYTDNIYRSWDFSLLYIFSHSHWTHFFWRSVHHGYTSYMFIFNCLIEFYCTILRFSHPFDSHPFLSISLLSSFVPLTVTNSGQWAIKYKFLCVHMQEFLWVKGMCIYRISTNCQILLWSSCINYSVGHIVCVFFHRASSAVVTNVLKLVKIFEGVGE